MKTAISAACVVSLAPLTMPALAKSSPAASPAGQGSVASLAKTLRSIGGNICIDAARRLEALPVDADRFNLHLRQAGLGEPGARLLAEALQSLGAGASLNSFSLSYNPGMGDAGASLIAHALPTSLPELGMVGCALGDTAGEALLRWAGAAPDLHTMCIEQNRFSDGLKARFNDLGRQRPNFLMVV